jgi:hypothetical protein
VVGALHQHGHALLGLERSAGTVQLAAEPSQRLTVSK